MTVEVFELNSVAISHSENNNVRQHTLCENEIKAAVQETINGTAA